MEEKILFAVPKKGRLLESSLRYLYNAGIHFKKNERLDLAQSSTLPEVYLIFLPAKDIAQYVGKGEVDLGITGQDVVRESKVEVVEKLRFEFHKCTLAVQAPKGLYTSPKDLVGKRVVTSFPHITKEYFETLNPNQPTEIRTVTGSVEVACKLGLADGVVDLVETGETMVAAGLEMLGEIMQSKPVLIINPKSVQKKLIEKLAQRLEGVAMAEKYVLIEYNIRKIDRVKAEQITPGQTSPTISPLENLDWIAIKSMILKSEANTIMDKLQEVGAADILIYSIENCRI